MKKTENVRPVRKNKENHHAPYHALAPISNLEEGRLLLPLAQSIVDERQGQLTVLYDVKVPEGQPLSEAASLASRGREALAELLKEIGLTTVQVKTRVRKVNEIWDGIWETVAEEQIDVLIFAWSTPAMPDTAVGSVMDPRLSDPPCDIVSIHPAEGQIKPDDWSNMRRILLPVRGGPDSTLILRVGHAFAEKTNATITLLHVASGYSRLESMQFEDEFSPALHGLERVRRSITSKGELTKAIIEESQDHQLIIIGAPEGENGTDGWMGSMVEQIFSNTGKTLVVVKECCTEVMPPITKEESAAVQVDRPVAVVVDRWFAENTYHSREFADLERLLSLKEEQGTTISLGLPALNEEETVGKVIQTLKTALMEQIPLLDEMVLIDSGSVDYTREIAQDLGIPVYIHQEILPQYGSFHGKGEALWKSLFVMEGDIVAWVDTDIKNIHPRFVYGILGPLLSSPKVQYVKGYYRRPLRQGDKLVAGGGGRVTELTARPFINLFFPELSGLIQPLSGEYAGRRAALERLPFFSGYGVETGLLIDLLQNFGLGAIAQVDLLERIHHNQPLPSLSKMSFTIMQVVLKRLSEKHNVRLLDEANLTMNLVRYGPRRYYLETQELRERERPPMLRLPEYRKKLDKEVLASELRTDGGNFTEGVMGV